MRGLLSHLYTRVYFADEEAANARDHVLLPVPAERRETLIAGREQRAGVAVYPFDIHMQAGRETVFFDVWGRLHGRSQTPAGTHRAFHGTPIRAQVRSSGSQDGASG